LYNSNIKKVYQANEQKRFNTKQLYSYRGLFHVYCVIPIVGCNLKTISTMSEPFDVIPKPSTSHMHPLHLVQQMWKGFCLPHREPSNLYADEDDDNNIQKHQLYEKQFMSTTLPVETSPSATAAATAMSTRDVPRCIDLSSNGEDVRRRINSCEFDTCNSSTASSCCIVDCNGDIATFALISSDSYDINDDYIDEDVNNDIVILTSSSANQRIRATRGVGTFLCALVFFVFTIYVIQKQQPHKSYNFHFHQGIKYELSRQQHLWGWHYKRASVVAMPNNPPIPPASISLSCSAAPLIPVE
jgi:hypothetical protein